MLSSSAALRYRIYRLHLTVVSAVADTLAFTPSEPITSCNADPGCGDRNNINPVNLGLVFTANTNFSVTAMGFCLTSDDTASEVVALYDSSDVNH